ncbi:hypothetical protein [Nafulsella turpanensis]|uniref:hypothetical protein n=1 Tax=Nafulsella turpanensis TaxID=1265690 RepID=UPI00034BED0A|nr:hypothetical protein [Nafulsella turpanensis]
MKNSFSRFSLLLLILLLCVAACRRVVEEKEGNIAPSYINALWATDTLWDDGLAEVAVYDAEREVYGRTRDFEYTFILVKEDFNQAYNVKTDDYSREDLFPVMKVNKFARIPTQKYPYHYLSSLFFKREAPNTLHKMTQSSQEWCGNTFKLFEHTGDHYRYEYTSYWDGQGDGEMQLPDTLWFEDALSYTLRALRFEVGLTFDQTVLESQVTNSAPEPKVYQAQFKVSEDETVLSDTVRPAWRVEAQLEEGKTNTYWFAKEYPNILLKQQSWDGRNMELKSATREAYWAVE